MAKFLLAILLITFVSPVWAELDPNASEEQIIQDKARKRLYPGGIDEEDLQVLDDVTKARKKVSRRTVERDVYKTLFDEDLKVGPDDSSDEDDAPEEE